MIATIILAVLIGLYFLWVIRKKYKDVKKGKFCNCGCSDCPSSGKKCKKE
jgi:hypothetical protein